uniref:Uncharacterized protein n=1 Tax=Cacopsylla melanoneura TaxID=428564 RepID=A0A8D9ARV1_9HEMI
MNSKYFVCQFVSQHLDKAVGLIVGLGATVGGEREFANFVFDTVALEILFSSADPAHFRVSVDDRGNTVVVNVTGTSSNSLNTHNAFVFCLVRQHWAMNTVPDGENVGNHCLEPRVNGHTPLFVPFDSNLF